MSTSQKPREVIREGAAEVKEKLRADISNWAKFRRFISLAPTMACLECEGTGSTPCSGCGGTGKQKLVWNDEEAVCATCEGKATVTCTECMGKGRVKNKQRKLFLWLFGLGALGWVFFFFRLWGGDVAPELRSKYLHGGGGGGTAKTRFAPRGNKPVGNVNQPTTDGSGQTGTDGSAAPPVGNAPTGVDPSRGGPIVPQGGGLRQ
jgi:hypothetical protein